MYNFPVLGIYKNVVSLARYQCGTWLGADVAAWLGALLLRGVLCYACTCLLTVGFQLSGSSFPS